MAANDMRVWIMYESGCTEIITAPDVGYSDGYCFQSEFVDISDPDTGIFWERSFVPMDDERDASGPEPDPWRVLHQRTMVVTPQMMPSVLAVKVSDVLSLVRHPEATASCGLLNVAIEQALGTPGESSDESFPSEGSSPDPSQAASVDPVTPKGGPELASSQPPTPDSFLAGIDAFEEGWGDE